MTILDEIVAFKHKEVELAKNKYPLSELKKSELYTRNGYSLKNNLLNNNLVGIIAEFKRKSPSKKNINLSANLKSVVQGYEKNNISGISVLTDHHFFGGSISDLEKTRSYVGLPILRKDFIIDKYQIHEAKAFGADVILLIANILSPEKVKQLAKEAKDLNIEVLLEIDKVEHSGKHIIDDIDIIGINNRNLKTFTTSIENSIRLFDEVPNKFVKISESGIHSVDDAINLYKKGFNGLLMGQQFMKNECPEIACQNFINELKKYNEN